MVFERYNRQFSKKDSAGASEPQAQRPASGAGTSSYLSRLAGQVGTPSSPSGGRYGSGGGNTQIWTGSKANESVRSSIQKRLDWVETAFKKEDEKREAPGDARSIVSSVRNRINALLTYDLSPKVRMELELIDKELEKIQ